ncbi:hypothetical protein ACNKHS_02535 [Shigella flexneri]
MPVVRQAISGEGGDLLGKMRRASHATCSCCSLLNRVAKSSRVGLHSAKGNS